MFSSLAEVSEIAFSLSPISDGVEQTFEVRSRVKPKARSRLRDSKADQQTNITFNSGQRRSINDGVLDTGCDKASEKALVMGFDLYAIANSNPM